VPDFDAESFQRTVRFVSAEVATICSGINSDVSAVHDVGGGGLATALAEMVATTGRGLNVQDLSEHAELFSEFPGRFVMATSSLDAFLLRCDAAGVAAEVLGVVASDRLVIGEFIDLSVSDIERRRRSALEEALASVG
jgi:phosphoribosylformylglycinamidine (FGAM) synthase-like enzyme